MKFKKNLMLFAVLAMLSAGCSSPKPGKGLFGETVDETRAYLGDYEHVLLVCVVEDYVSDGEHPARSNLHFTGTVVHVYQGAWVIGDRIMWSHDLDQRIPLESNKHAGELFFVFTDSRSNNEFHLDTGSWLRWDKDLDHQIKAALE